MAAAGPQLTALPALLRMRVRPPRRPRDGRTLCVRSAAPSPPRRHILLSALFLSMGEMPYAHRLFTWALSLAFG